MTEGYKKLLKKIDIEGIVSAPRDLTIKELIGERLDISDNNVLVNCPVIRDVLDPFSKAGIYLRAEFIWYMAGLLDPAYISYFGKMWDRLRNPGCHEFSYTLGEMITKTEGLVNSNYGYQVFYKPVLEEKFYDKINNIPIYYSYENSSFKWIISELNKDRDSRKAIIQYTLPNIYYKGVKDFTCTQNQHFLIRENKLYNIVTIRSSDAIKGLTFDLPWWDFVGQAVARITGAVYSDMCVNIGSSHYYSTNKELVEKLINSEDFKMKKLILRSNFDIKNSFINLLSSFEEDILRKLNLLEIPLPLKNRVPDPEKHGLYGFVSDLNNELHLLYSRDNESFESLLIFFMKFVTLYTCIMSDDDIRGFLNADYLIEDFNNKIFRSFFDFE